MTKKQRTQLKGLICILAILLLLILFIVNLVVKILHGRPVRPEKIPVVETVKNVWILEASPEEITVFADGTNRSFVPAKRSAAGELSDKSDRNLKRPESEDSDTGSLESQQIRIDGLGRVSWGTQKEGTENTDAENPGAGATNASGADTGDVLETDWEKLRDKIADITLTDGIVTEIRLKDEKIHAKLRRVGKDFVELEGYGRLELAGDYRGYRFYGEPAMKSASELVIGYDFADYVMEEGKVCAILFAAEEAMETIRVLLKSSGYQELFHERLEITGDVDFTVRVDRNGEQREETCGAGEICVIDSENFAENNGDELIAVTPAALTGKLYISNLKRDCGTPGYRGSLEIRSTERGLAVVNILQLEEYLYCVVPSEMPASYPPEALRAQAICARTYAYGRMQHAGYPLYGAHVDDSTSYQVYNNQKEQESATNAVKATHGQILRTQSGQTAETFYYSTSCGQGTDAKVWRTVAADKIGYLRGKKISRTAGEEPEPGTASEEFWWMSLLEGQENGLKGMDLGMLLEADMDSAESEGTRTEFNFSGAEFLLTRDENDFEAQQSWYRWIYPAEELDVQALRERLEKTTGQETEPFQKVTSLNVTARAAGGVADVLTVETDRGSYAVEGENAIRKVLCDGETQAILWNGKTSNCASLLPSAFFVMLPRTEKGSVTGFTLIGGGYGHGVGMSQNGAKEMALEGWTAEKILEFFYEECRTQAVY